MQRESPLIIRKDFTKSIPVFPVVLEEGDQFVIVKEIQGSQVPKGERWTINGYTRSGPILSEESTE